MQCLTKLPGQQNCYLKISSFQRTAWNVCWHHIVKRNSTWECFSRKYLEVEIQHLY